MKYALALASLLSTTLAIHLCYGDPYDEEYGQALLVSAPLRTIRDEEVKRRTQEQKELQACLDYIERHAQDYEEDLASNVLDAIVFDMACFAAADDQIDGMSPGIHGLTYQMKYSKACLGAELACGLLRSSFDEIKSGCLPAGYSISSPNTNVVGEAEHIYASSRGRALKHLLLRTVAILSECPDIHAAFRVLEFNADTSPWIQSIPLPDNFNLEGFEGCPFFSEGHMKVIHNGYAFGGNRLMPENPFPAHDCSSFVAHYAGLEHPATTRHHVIGYQLEHGIQFEEPEVVARWEEKRDENTEDPWVIALRKRLNPLPFFDINDTPPVPLGSVYTHGSFGGIPQSWDAAPFSRGGHTAFVLSFRGQGPDRTVVTLGANRDIEGSNKDFIYGIEEFPANMGTVFGDRKMRMYFTVKEDNQ